jgi:hypothetical protein
MWKVKVAKMMSSHHSGELFTVMKNSVGGRYGEIPRPYASMISNITQFFMEILRM